ncbi:hypothetical protein [Streptomyces sp. KR80]|uniref:hypothetical protein n=1 Tax=Streptomyces sp. KR80 TaxID=3457426 RepID=UPI003FD086B2
MHVHPVVVLDEVDKLTDNRQEAIAELELLLGRLKNVLTARGAHFILVAGPDLHDQALDDADRGNGVYENTDAYWDHGRNADLPLIFRTAPSFMREVKRMLDFPAWSAGASL